MNENKQTTEALDDILTEMREQADEPAIESLGEVISPIDPDDVKDWADRLEAAVNRMRDAYCDLCKEKDAAYDRLLLERDKAIQTSASGNVATMRKALEAIVTVSDCFRGLVIDSGVLSGDAPLIHRAKMLALDMSAQFSDAHAALAKPARNCDRFDDEQDAQLEFLNEVWLISVDKESMLESDKFENWTDEMRMRYARWLLAPCATCNDTAGPTR